MKRVSIGTVEMEYVAREEGIEIFTESMKSELVETLSEDMTAKEEDKLKQDIDSWFNENITSVDDMVYLKDNPEVYLEKIWGTVKEPALNCIVKDIVNDKDVSSLFTTIVIECESKSGKEKEEKYQKYFQSVKNDIANKLKMNDEMLKELFDRLYDIYKIKLNNGEIVAEEVEAEEVADTEPVTETVDETSEKEIIEAEVVEEKNQIEFDDSNLVEVVILNDTVDGLLVRANNVDISINHIQLISMNSKCYISKELYDSCTRNMHNEELAKLRENDWFKKLMSTLDPSLNIRYDIFPRGDKSYDFRFFIPNGNSATFDMTFDLGTFITKQVKVTFPSEQGIIGIAIGKDDKLLTNLLTYKYSLDELQKMNCLNKNVINLSEHLNLIQVPAHSLPKLVENIYNHKQLLEKITEGFFVFDKTAKISSKKFSIFAIDDNNRKTVLTYNEGKVTTKIE